MIDPLRRSDLVSNNNKFNKLSSNVLVRKYVFMVYRVLPDCPMVSIRSIRQHLRSLANVCWHLHADCLNVPPNPPQGGRCRILGRLHDWCRGDASCLNAHKLAQSISGNLGRNRTGHFFTATFSLRVNLGLSTRFICLSKLNHHNRLSLSIWFFIYV